MMSFLIGSAREVATPAWRVEGAVSYAAHLED